MICEWEAADEPWQFLAACREYYEVMIACTKQSTCLMVATDATCVAFRCSLVSPGMHLQQRL